MRDINIPEAIHDTINTTEDLGAIISNSDHHPSESNTDVGNSLNPYDIEMKFDAKGLGASVTTLSENVCCQVCELSVWEEKVSCDGCTTTGHKYCFNNLSP